MVKFNLSTQPMNPFTVSNMLVSFARLKLPINLRPQKLERKTRVLQVLLVQSLFQGFERFTDGSLEGNMLLLGKPYSGLFRP